MTILRPREQDVLPKWHLSVVLKGLMKPPFTINGTDRKISLELLSCKTAFLIALATGARGSELVVLSRASLNLEFTTLASGAKQASIRMVPKFIPKISDQRSFLNLLGFREWLIFSWWTWATPLPSPGSGSLYCQVGWSCTRRLSGEVICALQPCYSDAYHAFSSLGCWDYSPDVWKFFQVQSTENQGTWRQGNFRINCSLPEFSSERIMQIDWMEIVQRIRTPLSSRHGGRYGTPGHPSGGRTDGFPVIWCPNSSSLATSTNIS